MWSPGLFVAAIIGRDDSTPHHRGKYSNQVKEYMYLGKDNALNIALLMVIDDGDSLQQRRSNIYSTFNTLLGLA